MPEDAQGPPPKPDPDDAREALQRLDDAIASLGTALREARDDVRLDLTPVLQRRLQDRIGRREVDLVVQPVDLPPTAGGLVRAVVDAAAWFADRSPERIAIRLDPGADGLRFFVGVAGDVDAGDLREQLDSPGLAPVRDAVEDRDGEIFVDAHLDAVGLGWTVPR